MAGERGWLEAQALGRIEHHEAEDEGGELCTLGLSQHLLIRAEEQLRNIAAGDLVRDLDKFPGRMADPARAHAGALGALAWKRERKQPVSFRPATGEPGRSCRRAGVAPVPRPVPAARS